MSKIANYWLIQQSVYENIKFADAKSASLVALNLAIITGLYSLKVFDKCNIYLFVVSCAAFCFLAFSIICSVIVLFPRGERTYSPKKTSLCDLYKIAAFKSYYEYKKNVTDSSNNELLEDIALFIYDRSRTNKIKYLWLKIEIILGAIGWCLSFIISSIIILV